MLLQAPDQEFLRRRADDGFDLVHVLSAVSEQYDFILVQGHKDSPIPKLWLLHPTGEAGPPDRPEILASLPPGPDRLSTALPIIEERVRTQWRKTLLFGCVAACEGRAIVPSRLARADDRLSPLTDQVIVVGLQGARRVCPEMPRLPHVAGVPGALGCALATMRWAPRAAWLVFGESLCDVDPETPEALAAARRPGVWRVWPEADPTQSRISPLALLDFWRRSLLEWMAMRGASDLTHLAAARRASTVLFRPMVLLGSRGPCARHAH